MERCEAEDREEGRATLDGPATHRERWLCDVIL